MITQSKERPKQSFPIKRRTALFWLAGLMATGIVTRTEIDVLTCTQQRTGYLTYPGEEMLPEIRAKALIKNPNITDIESLDKNNLMAAQQKWSRMNSDCRVLIWKGIGETIFNSAKRFVRW